MDEQVYLEPDFDPASLTVPRLRSILVAHGIEYPASSKKPQLIQIFNDNVLPQARRLRAANARVKRTSYGIEDVPSQSSTTTNEEEFDEESAPVRPTPRSSRRSTRSRTEEAENTAPTPRVSRYGTAPPDGAAPRRASSKHARQVETGELEPESKRQSTRQSRPSAATPVVKQESSPFSNENVFQSGGSPPAPTATDRRRTVMGASRTVDRQRSRDARRRTEEHRPVREQLGNAVVPSRKKFDIPASRTTKVKEQYPDEVEPAEEFTPDEEEALVQAQQSGELVPTRRKTKQPSNNATTLGPAALLTALLAGFATLWRQEKLQVGYCGVGHPSTEIAGTHVPEWAEVLRPQCEPCPPHAYCSDNLAVDCEPGFVYTQHPLCLGGLVPLPPSCEPDSAQQKRVQAVAARAVKELREQNAQYECGTEPSAQVSEDTLKTTISSQRRKGMSNEEFEDLWSFARDEILDSDEVISASDGKLGFTLRSTSLASLPLGCAIRRSLRATLRAYLWQAIGLLFLLSSGLYTQKAITTSRSTEARAKELASMALRKLGEQAALHTQDPGRYGEGFVSMAQLRDDVLRDEFSAKRRTKLWEKVKVKVEGNANVRPMVREGRGGDVGRVWEWIGAVPKLEIENGQSPEGRGQWDGVVAQRGDREALAGEKIVEPGVVKKEGGSWWREGGKYY